MAMLRRRARSACAAVALLVVAGAGCRSAGAPPEAMRDVAPPAGRLCYPTSEAESNLLDYALRMAGHAPGSDGGPPPGVATFDSAAVALVRDERTCARAAAAYAGVARDARGAAPVPVEVVRAGRVYLVDRPRAPIRAGEFTIIGMLDLDFRWIGGLAG
jgi:hypothetical protein